jgi:Common central domain of tyrosinase
MDEKEIETSAIHTSVTIDVPDLRRKQLEGLTSGVRLHNGKLRVRREIDDFIKDNDVTNIFMLGLDDLMKTDWRDPFSYFQIAGIHGKPHVAWQGVQPDLTGNPESGYCSHSSILFPTWHRAYLMMFEQALYLKMVDLANEYPEPWRRRYLDATNRFSLPYWDPFLPRKKLKNVHGYYFYQTGLPIILTIKTVMVRRAGNPNVKTELENPLCKFNFPPEPVIPRKAPPPRSANVPPADVSHHGGYRPDRDVPPQDGYRNSTHRQGDYNVGSYRQSGHSETGYRESIYREGGYVASGYRGSGYHESGYQEPGHQPASYQDSSHQQAGYTHVVTESDSYRQQNEHRPGYEVGSTTGESSYSHPTRGPPESGYEREHESYQALPQPTTTSHEKGHHGSEHQNDKPYVEDSHGGNSHSQYQPDHSHGSHGNDHVNPDYQPHHEEHQHHSTSDHTEQPVSAQHQQGETSKAPKDQRPSLKWEDLNVRG